MIYSVKIDETLAYIHAENLNYAISTAKRLGRHVFHTTKVWVREVNHPTENQVLSADQCMALLGEPIPVKKVTAEQNHVQDLWANFAKELQGAGL